MSVIDNYYDFIECEQLDGMAERLVLLFSTVRVDHDDPSASTCVGVGRVQGKRERLPLRCPFQRWGLVFTVQKTCNLLLQPFRQKWAEVGLRQIKPEVLQRLDYIGRDVRG